MPEEQAPFVHRDGSTTPPMKNVSSLMAAFLAVDNSTRTLMRFSGSNRQKEELRDAIADLRRHVLDVVALNIADGSGEFDVELFRAIVRRGAALGLWQEMATAFNQIGREPLQP